MKPECNGTTLPPCIYNNTQYNQFHTSIGIQCYEPKAVGSVTSSIYVYGYKGGSTSLEDQFAQAQKSSGYISHNITRGEKPTTVCFDACLAIDKGQGWGSAGVPCGGQSWEQSYIQYHKYLFTRSTASSYGGYRQPSAYWYTSGRGPNNFNLSITPASTDCRSHHCTPICLSAHVAGTLGTRYYHYGIGIDKTGKDPYGYILVKTEATKLTNQPVKFFWSYEQEIEKLNDLPTPPRAKNMFINLAQEVARELMLKNCFVCGGTTMGDRWPWHVQEANYTEIAQWHGNFTFNNKFNETWQVTSHIVGQICYTRNKNNQTNRNKPMGFLKCSNEWENNTWISQTNMTQPENSLINLTKLQGISDPENDTIEWNSPDGLYWICGNFAYNMLPAGWYGSCILGAIQPSFFLIPIEKKQKLGIPAYDTLERRKRSVNLSKGTKIGNWKDDEWPPERIIAYYDPASWAQDGSWGYRTPIYICLIELLDYKLC
ncbi:PREDICTED: endogenous retrovirus group 3 member 1 Env polyprotein-like [Thamnophis sirtalis]|uniref:Endogenous retrovirus group 3 member 1 Env polyprotein-like n=1 Tax=Thamnophis sirtalis TaxID=35019 RepID=A0A6I9Y5Y0_9SAUR|nr:PREDICTED: endogenous retrovirus group 3 member 1 Env polyprotein-like [Thamnophis sirtalis]